MFPGRREKATGFISDRRFPLSEEFLERSPLPVAYGDSLPIYSQNVAGLWLKYGVNPSKQRLLRRTKIFRSGDDLLTTAVDNLDWAGL